LKSATELSAKLKAEEEAGIAEEIEVQSSDLEA